MPRKQTEHRFVLCVRNDDCEDLERRKVYRVLGDEKAEKNGYLLSRPASMLRRGLSVASPFNGLTLYIGCHKILLSLKA